MTYPTIVAKKIRMCRRFGHLPETVASHRVSCALRLRTYACHRCGEILRRTRLGAA